MDLQRSQFFFITNGLAQVLEENQKRVKTINELLTSYKEIDESAIKHFLEQLINADIGFFTDSPEWFPDIDIRSNLSNQINSVTAVIENDNVDQLSKVLQNQSILSIQAIFLSLDFDLINLFLAVVSNWGVRNIQLYVDLENLQDVSLDDIKFYNNIESIIFYNSTQNKLDTWNQDVELRYTSKPILDEYNFLSEKDFIINPLFYSEAKTGNPFLQGRIFVGDFKEFKTSLGSLLRREDEHHYSRLNIENVGKDQITSCRDCEYRYMCTDTRIPEEHSDSNQIWLHKRMCTYNPYIAKWEDENGYVTIEKCIDEGVVTNEYIYRSLESK